MAMKRNEKEFNREALNKLGIPLDEFILPSGYTCIIREHNGEDDELITTEKHLLDGTSIHRYVASIIQLHGYYGNGVTLKQVKEMPIRDIYTILIKSRIFSIGEIIEFSYTFSDDEDEQLFREDLRRYIHNYESDFPKEGEEGYDKYKLEPYIDDPYENDIIIKLTSGKEVKMNYAQGQAETHMALLDSEKRNINQELKARNIQFKSPDFSDWKTVISFSVFSKKDMQQIRTALRKVDPPLAIITDLEDPKNGNIHEVNVAGLQDFFFPRDL